MANSSPEEYEDSTIEQTETTPPSLDEIIRSRERAGRSTGTSKPSTRKPSSVVETTVSVEVQRERTRTWLAGGLLGLLSLSLLGSGVYIFADLLFIRNSDQQRADMHRELITIIWTSQVTLVSGALGYYFGSEPNKSGNSED